MLTRTTCRGSCCETVCKTPPCRQCVCKKNCADGEYIELLSDWTTRRSILAAMSAIAQTVHHAQEIMCDNVPKPGHSWRQVGWDCSNSEFKMMNPERCKKQGDLGERSSVVEKATEAANSKFFMDTITSIKSAASSALKAVKSKVPSSFSSGLKSAGKVLAFKLIDLLPNKNLGALLKEAFQQLIEGRTKKAMFVLMRGAAEIFIKPMGSRLIVKVLQFVKFPLAPLVWQKICQAQAEVLPKDEHGKIQMNGITVSAAMMGRSDYEETPNGFEMYVIRAPKFWFKDQLKGEWGVSCAYPNHKYAPWVPPSATHTLSGKSCKTTWKKDDPNGPDCIAKVNMKYYRCNTCCCKDGPIKMQVSLTMSHGSGQVCAAWFSVADFLVRAIGSCWRGFDAFNNYNHRCWRVDASWTRFPRE